MRPSKRVAVVMQPVRQYCRAVLRGVASVSAQARWDCVLIPADAPPSATDLAGFVQGVIGHFSEVAHLEPLERAATPAVDVSPARPQSTLPRVCTDDVAVGRLAASYLLSLGLPHFGIYGSRGRYESLLREQGFKQAIGDAGLSCHVLLGADVDVDADTDGGPAGASDGAPDAGADESLEKWVRRLPKPVGILATTDSRGLDVLAVCRKLNVDVPRSVAVVGVGDDEVFCELANPTLSSIALATQRIGYEAARLLERLMAGERPAQRQLLIPPAGVVTRRSSDIPAIVDEDVAAAVRYISLHVGDHLQVEDVLREVPLSRRSLEHRFLKALGRTPAAEIRRAQVEAAKQLLAETNDPMARVASAAGFSSAKQFTATFHHETGMTPTAYRREKRGK